MSTSTTTQKPTVSPRKLAANRANARKSIGPQSKIQNPDSPPPAPSFHSGSKPLLFSPSAASSTTGNAAFFLPTMKIDGHDIGICSWSLRAPSLAATLEGVKELGLAHLQLAVGDLLSLDDAGKKQVRDQLQAAGISLTASMIGFPGEDYSSIQSIRKTGGFVPDDLWPARRQRVLDAARLTADLGMKLLTTHIGFVPPSSHPAYPQILDRLREVAQGLEALGLTLVMETGQERASELLQFLNDLNCRNVGVNFDPANMILYGAGDPIEAIGILGRHIRHVHVKDATASDKPGVAWGREVAFGTGQVDPGAFLGALNDAGYRGPLVIEREAGDNRIADIRAGIQSLQRGAGA
jgi:sugar phosphate isomerase/epimerase